MSRAAICIALFLVGVALLFPFDHAATLFFGVAFLIAFVVFGVFTIASPEFLAATDESPDLDEPGPTDRES
jgi:hypothetical protein